MLTSLGFLHPIRMVGALLCTRPLQTSTLRRKADRKRKKSNGLHFCPMGKLRDLGTVREGQACSVEAKSSMFHSTLYQVQLQSEGSRGAQPNSLRAETGWGCSKKAGIENNLLTEQADCSTFGERCSLKGQRIEDSGTVCPPALWHTFQEPGEVGLVLGD